MRIQLAPPLSLSQAPVRALEGGRLSAAWTGRRSQLMQNQLFLHSSAGSHPYWSPTQYHLTLETSGWPKGRMPPSSPPSSHSGLMTILLRQCNSSLSLFWMIQSGWGWMRGSWEQLTKQQDGVECLHFGRALRRGLVLAQSLQHLRPRRHIAWACLAEMRMCGTQEAQNFGPICLPCSRDTSANFMLWWRRNWLSNLLVETWQWWPGRWKKLFQNWTRSTLGAYSRSMEFSSELWRYMWPWRHLDASRQCLTGAACRVGLQGKRMLSGGKNFLAGCQGSKYLPDRMSTSWNICTSRYLLDKKSA